jgi:hypothetical protein
MANGDGDDAVVIDDGEDSAGVGVEAGKAQTCPMGKAAEVIGADFVAQGRLLQLMLWASLYRSGSTVYGVVISRRTLTAPQAHAEWVSRGCSHLAV